MARVALKRKNFMVEEAKVRRLRRALGARSESEALRILIDQELAVRGIQKALRGLRERGTLVDVFKRLRTGPK